MFKNVTFNWNKKRIMSGFISLAVMLILVLIVDGLILLGFMMPVFMFFPELMEQVSELMAIQTSPQAEYLVSLIPVSVMLLTMIITGISIYKVFLRLQKITDNIWDKIPNRIKGEPVVIKNKESARQAI